MARCLRLFRPLLSSSNSKATLSGWRHGALRCHSSVSKEEHALPLLSMLSNSNQNNIQMTYGRKKTDAALGLRVHQHLVKLGIETPGISSQIENIEKNENNASNILKEMEKYNAQIDEISKHMRSIMECLGMDVNNASLQETPERVAHMFKDELLYGMDLRNFPKIQTKPYDYNTDNLNLTLNRNGMHISQS